MELDSAPTGVLFVMLVFFFNDTATTELYTLSLHDALPIYDRRARLPAHVQEQQAKNRRPADCKRGGVRQRHELADRKSTRLNSSHVKISYAVFCLKKKKKEID